MNSSDYLRWFKDIRLEDVALVGRASRSPLDIVREAEQTVAKAGALDNIGVG
jgi:hypothetical protein